MKYKDFDSFKINEGKVMNTTNFGDFEMAGDHECKHDIFKLFPKHRFAMVLKSGRCYVYDSKGERIKHWDLETLEKADGIDVKKYSIIATANGQYIKEQYEKLSKLTVVDVIQYIKKDKDKKKKKKVRKEWNFDGDEGQPERLFGDENIGWDDNSDDDD